MAPPEPRPVVRSALGRLLLGLHRLEDVAAMAILSALIVVVTIQLAGRTLAIAVPWTEEVSRLLLIWVSFLGGAIVLRENDHIVIDLVYVRLPAKVRAVIDVVVALTVAGVLVVIVDVAWSAVQESAGRALPATGWPRMLLEAAPWVCGLLMLIHLAENVVRQRRSKAIA